MTEPLVSVKMITYNHAPYIAQAIEGVLKQRIDFSIELVIGEDCSTDGTREIVFDYQKKYPDIIRVITSKENVGGKKNGYRTMKACRGKYIAFCEGDDYWHHLAKLQTQVNYMEAHPECGMVSSDVDIYYHEENKFKRNYNYSHGYTSNKTLSMEQVLWGGLFIWTCTVLIRRNIYDLIIENDSYLHKNENMALGDLQVWAELTKIAKLIYIPETMATYRVLKESASRSKDRKKELRFLKSLSDIKIHLAKKYSLPEDYLREEEKRWIDRALLLALYEHNSELADEAKNRLKILSLKEIFRFYGAKNRAFNYFYRITAFFLFFLRKKRKEWP